MQTDREDSGRDQSPAQTRSDLVVAGYALLRGDRQRWRHLLAQAVSPLLRMHHYREIQAISRKEVIDHLLCCNSDNQHQGR